MYTFLQNGGECLVRKPTQLRFWQAFVEYMISWDDLGNVHQASLLDSFAFIATSGETREKKSCLPQFIVGGNFECWQNICADIHRNNSFLGIFILEISQTKHGRTFERIWLLREITSDWYALFPKLCCSFSSLRSCTACSTPAKFRIMVVGMQGESAIFLVVFWLF